MQLKHNLSLIVILDPSIPSILIMKWFINRSWENFCNTIPASSNLEILIGPTIAAIKANNDEYCLQIDMNVVFWFKNQLGLFQ